MDKEIIKELKELNKKASRRNELLLRVTNNVIFWFWALVGWWLIVIALAMAGTALNSIF